MLYEGPLYTFFDPSDRDKSIVFGVELDSEDQLYIAIHVDGKPFLRNAVFGKRYGKNAGDESAGKADKRSFLYISRQAAMELYDLLGGIFGGEMIADHLDMEHPANAPTLTIDDMLNELGNQ